MATYLTAVSFQRPLSTLAISADGLFQTVLGYRVRSWWRRITDVARGSGRYEWELWPDRVKVGLLVSRPVCVFLFPRALLTRPRDFLVETFEPRSWRCNVCLLS